MIASDVIPSAIDRIHAEREVEELEREGATFWRLAGAVPGQRSRFVDETLRDRLVDALAEVNSLSESKLRETISEWSSEIAKLDDKHDIGDDFESKIRRVCDADPEGWPERVWDLIDAMGERLAEQREQIGRLKSERSEQPPAPPPSNVRLLRPGLRKGKPRLGSTTMSLFGQDPEPEVKEVVPTKVGKVDVAEKKRGRPRKTKAVEK